MASYCYKEYIGWFPPIPHTGNRHDFPSQPLQISSKGVVPCFPDLSKSLEEELSSACFKAIEDLQRCRNGLKKCLNASHIKCTKMYQDYQGSTFASTRALTASCWPISTATFAPWKVETCGNIGSYIYEAMSIRFQEKLQQTSKNLEDKTQTCLLSKSKAANKGVAPCWP
jgi:hypothetical protein